MKFKPFFQLIGYCCILMTLSACDSNTTPTEQLDIVDLNEDYYEFQGFNLKPFELPYSIMLPDETANIGAATVPEISHKEGDFYWDIAIGSNFKLHIEDYGDYNDLIPQKRNELKNQKIFKVEYLVNEKNLIVYKQTLMVKGSKNASPKVGVEHSSYHVYGQKEFNNISYELSSSEEGSTKEIITLMAKSIKSFKPKK